MQQSFIPDEHFQTETTVINVTDLPDDYRGPEPDRQLIDSIRNHGLLTPIIVRPLRGKYALIDGRRRVAALRKLVAEDTEGGWHWVNAVVVHTDRPVSAAVLTATLHATRDENVAAELRAIEEMIEKGGTERDIFEATGLAIGTIRQRTRLLNAITPEIRELLDGAKIVPSVAESISRLPPSKQRQLREKYDAEGKLTAKDAREMRSAAAAAVAATLPDSIFAAAPGTVETNNDISYAQAFDSVCRELGIGPFDYPTIEAAFDAAKRRIREMQAAEATCRVM